jgi:hypothetical protein
MPLELTPIEQEATFLKATWEAINSMVNLSLLSLHGDDPDCSVLFHNRNHQQLFNIGLVDFLSKTDRRGPVAQSSYLAALGQISETPHFSVEDSIEGLRRSTSDFATWLNDTIVVDVWFPSISLETPLRVSRLRYIKMTGDLSKHNFLRAVGVAEDIQSLLASQGVEIDIGSAMLALENFYEWFHDHVFNYHASTISEFLNNIRWGIHDYLQPEFARSIVHDLDNPPMYRFTYPPGVDSKFGQQTYWDLMNLVRGRPYMRKFKVTRWQKLRY